MVYAIKCGGTHWCRMETLACLGASVEIDAGHQFHHRRHHRIGVSLTECLDVMGRSVRVAGFLLALLLGVAIGHWGTGTDPAVDAGSKSAGDHIAAPSEEPSSRAKASSSTSLPSAVRSTPVAPPVAPAQTRPEPLAVAGLGFDGPQYLASLPAHLDDLSVRALAGDAAALGELAEFANYCTYAEGIARFAGRHGTPASSSLADPEVGSFFKQLTSVCTGWLSKQQWLADEKARLEQAQRERRALSANGVAPPAASNEPRTLGESLRRRAAERGDLASTEGENQDCGLAPGTAAGSSANPDFRQCEYRRNSELLERIIRNRDVRSMAVVPALITGVSSEFFVGGQDTALLWQLAACQYGLNCGPTGQLLRNACVFGVCGYAHYRDYAADQLLPPALMRSAESRLPRLLALIQAGNVVGILGPPPR